MSTHQALAAIDKCLKHMEAQSDRMRDFQRIFNCLQDVHEIAKNDVHTIATVLTELLGAINTAPGQHDATKNNVHDITIALTDLLGTTNKVLESIDNSMSVSGCAAQVAFIAGNINNEGHELAHQLAHRIEKNLMDMMDLMGKGDDDNEL
ncbi:hypothetical protein N7504_000820 [Penicillium tannophilum]|nr:hypothetical protein N7504_000820 [Penicillium tannophilum]